MLKIETNSGFFDLDADFSLQIDETSPMMNDRGSQSIPATIPYTSLNALLTGHAYRLDVTERPMERDPVCTVSDGTYNRRGCLNIVSASLSDGITFNIGFDNGEAYAAWREKMLTELSDLPTYGEVGDVLGLLRWMGEQRVRPTRDFSTFRVVVDDPEQPENDRNDYRIILNHGLPGSDALASGQRKIKILIDNEPTEVTVPPGYGYTAFLHVWRVLELVFADLNLSVSHNPFAEDPELRRLVVLNNCADACCTGVLDYADLLPDCTVDAFLNALHVRFGMVYNIDYTNNIADIRLIRDIISIKPILDLSHDITCRPLITYDTNRYISLSAKNTIDGTAPETERFEDFTKYTGTDSYTVTDEFDTAYKAKLVYVRPSGLWYKWDELNDTYSDPSSGFFSWDPKTKGLMAEALSSDDEWIPMRVYFDEPLPYFGTGPVHKHSYIKGQKRVRGKDSDAETPLAFLFSFTDSTNYNNSGSFTPYFGKNPIEFNDGSSHTLSLLFQFQNGLFDRFWKQYDEILRHGFYTVEVSARLSIVDLSRINVLCPIIVFGQLMLIDTFSYRLPSGDMVNVDFKLRTLRTLGIYDIEAEQGIPPIGPGRLVTQWVEASSTFAKESHEAAMRYLDEWQHGHPSMSSPTYRARAISTRKAEDDWKQDLALLDRTPEYDGELLTLKYSTDIQIQLMSFNKYGEWYVVHVVTRTIEYTVTLRGVLK